MHGRPTTVYTTTVKGTKIKGVNMSSMCFFLSLGWVRPEHFVDITSNIFSPEATGEEASNAVVLKVGGAPPWGGANTLQGGRDVTDGEKNELPPTCHWLVKAPSVAKCKGLD